MRTFLEKEEAAFFHITTYSKWEQIQQSSLIPFNRKGISAIRVFDLPIIHSVIALQLYAPEVDEENDYVVLKIPQSLNKFTPNEIGPDIVFEWTWPLQNNILRPSIEANNLELVDRFSINNWSEINTNDFRNENICTASKSFQQSYEIIYENLRRPYKVNSDSVRLLL